MQPDAQPEMLIYKNTDTLFVAAIVANLAQDFGRMIQMTPQPHAGQDDLYLGSFMLVFLSLSCINSDPCTEKPVF
jgi:hypothetical protein